MKPENQKYLSTPRIFKYIILGSLLVGCIYIYVPRDILPFNFINIYFGNNNTYLKENITRYVSVCTDTFNTRRTGNMMFVLAALLFVSKHTGRSPIMPQSFPHGWIDGFFVKDLPRYPNKFIYDPNNSKVFTENTAGPQFDDQFKYLHLNKNNGKIQTLLICGYFQSYRYVAEVEDELRSYLKFKNNTLKSVDKYIMNEVNNSSNVSFIGIHVRRTDYTYAYSVKSGLTVVDENYINISMQYVIESFDQSRSLVTFVCSDDINWVKGAISRLNFSDRYPNMKVVYSLNHDAAFDLCLLSKCNASIISTGTFSWWSGWLTNAKTVVYYSLYPNRNTKFGAKFSFSDYYPSTWKGLPDLKE